MAQSEVCYTLEDGTDLYSICCTDDNAPPAPPPTPLTPDELTVKRINSRHCPYTSGPDDLHRNNQENGFLREGGPVERLFQEEYIRFFDALLRMPEYQPCAVTDAMAVLLHPQHGVIREAFDEDRSFWTRDIDADDELDFAQAWARLRIAGMCFKPTAIQGLLVIHWFR